MLTRPHLIRCTTALILLLALTGLVAIAQDTATTISSGPGSFVFDGTQREFQTSLTIYTWAPQDLAPDTPILFVIPGVRRNARTYRDNWISHAKAKHVLLIVPEFPQAFFPGRAYQDGNVLDRSGKPRQSTQWTFTVIEQLFDQVKQMTGNQSATYYLYGHSAGAQFVHRFVLLMSHARCARAVAANPGWYLLPDEAKPYPAGLENTPTDDTVLRTVLSHNFTLLLGLGDVNPDDPDLPRNPDAMAEGP